MNHPRSSAEVVVLLHGLGRTRMSMRVLEREFSARGHRVVNIGYPSRRCTIETIIDRYIAPVVRELCDSGKKVHFVTHSLGGILVRKLFAEGKISCGGRVVMIAPPNHGSEVADALSQTSVGRFLLGVSGQQLITGACGVPCQLPPLNFECGVVLCDKCIDPILGRYLEKPHDGKVTVQSMHADGVKAYTTIHTSHTFSPRSKAVGSAAIRFIETGEF